MAEDEKKSFWSSLPGILTGLAAVLTAAGALIYHQQGKSKPRSEPIRQESSIKETRFAASPNQPTPPEGFQEQASYNGDCANPPAGTACIRFRDGFQWLVRDVVARRHEEVGSWGKHQEVEASGSHARYRHILGTQYVKTVAE